MSIFKKENGKERERETDKWGQVMEKHRENSVETSKQHLRNRPQFIGNPAQKDGS